MKFVWLASYPKSGNTWLRFLLYHYFFGTAQASADVNRRIPDLHKTSSETLLNTGLNPTLCKTHFMLTPEHPLFEQTAGFVYMVRHPKDVLLSNLNYTQLYQNTSEQEFILDFISSMGLPRWIENGFGSWVDHVESWLSARSQFPHLVISYEEMKKSPSDCFERVIRFLGMTVDSARLSEAVALSSFDSMKKLEENERQASVVEDNAFAINDQSRSRPFRFMNQGASGQLLSAYGPDLDAKFDARFKHMLEKLGYPSVSGC